MDYECVKKIIKERFALGDGGFTSFVENLELKVPEYSFLGDDGRKKYKISKELYPFVDDGFSILAGLASFTSAHNIGFDEYTNNKVLIKGNNVKLFKAATDFYSKPCSSVWSRLAGNSKINDISFAERVMIDASSEAAEPFRLMNKLYKPSEIKAFREVFQNQPKDAEETISFVLQKIFEKIGCYKVNTSNDLYFVLSRNFNDFFLCSSGEGWTSCLNPESPSGFWSALPFLVADPNRCMCIISDLSEKEYLGVKSIRMFKRGWGELDRNGVINTGMFYPAKEYISNSFFDQMNMEEKIVKMGGSFNSKYPINFFYNEYGVFDFLYQDDTFFNFVDEEIAYLRKGSKNHTIVLKGRGTRDYHMCSYKHGLTKLIEENKTIKEFPGIRFCPTCLQELDEEGKILYTLSDGREITSCRSCISKLSIKTKIKCPCCGEVVEKGLAKVSRIQKDDARVRALTCHNCIECARCSKVFGREEIVDYGSNKVCKKCHDDMTSHHSLKSSICEDPFAMKINIPSGIKKRMDMEADMMAKKARHPRPFGGYDEMPEPDEEERAN